MEHVGYALGERIESFGFGRDAKAGEHLVFGFQGVGLHASLPKRLDDTLALVLIDKPALGHPNRQVAKSIAMLGKGFCDRCRVEQFKH